MKTIALLAFFFFVALFAFSRAEFIYDSHGEVLKNGGSYYILPPGYGGESVQAATISASKRSSCSLAVALILSYDNGWATKISTPYPLNYITNDYPLNISFTSLPSKACTNTPSWVVTNVLGFDGDPVMVGNPEEFAVPRSGYFYIKKYESTKYYKFAFCYDKDNCGYVTLKTDTHNNRRFIVNQDRTVEPLVFEIVKATSDNDVASSGISMVV